MESMGVVVRRYRRSQFISYSMFEHFLFYKRIFYYTTVYCITVKYDTPVGKMQKQ